MYTAEFDSCDNAKPLCCVDIEGGSCSVDETILHISDYPFTLVKLSLNSLSFQDTKT